MEQYFNGLFHKKLAGALLKRIGISGTMPVHDLSEENLERLCRICKHFRTYIDKTNPFEQAQICAGGVDTSEIDPDTMESKLVKGLYFAGEILDVDGICGGYNLQWAWSSGYAAGCHAAAGIVPGYLKNSRAAGKTMTFSGAEGNRTQGKQERKKHTYDPDQSAHTSRGPRGRGHKEKGGKASKNR